MIVYMYSFKSCSVSEELITQVVERGTNKEMFCLRVQHNNSVRVLKNGTWPVVLEYDYMICIKDNCGFGGMI